jgi:hypothetical protein
LTFKWNQFARVQSKKDICKIWFRERYLCHDCDGTERDNESSVCAYTLSEIWPADGPKNHVKHSDLVGTANRTTAILSNHALEVGV